VFTTNSRLANEGGVGEVCRVEAGVAVLCETSKQAVNLSVLQDGGCPNTRIPEILDIEAIIAEI
jgi:hypothetical protein